MATVSLEERVEALEAEVQQLKRQQEEDKPSEEPRGWQRIVGIFQDDPAFEESVLEGRKWRESEDFPHDEAKS